MWPGLSHFSPFDMLFMTLRHEGKGTHKTCIIKQAIECVWVCEIAGRASAGFSHSWMSQQCRCMFPCTPLPCTGETWSLSLSLIFTATCTAERKPGLYMCVWSVCKTESAACVCVCGRWLWDVEGQVEKWTHRLRVWQPGVSVKLTVAVYGRGSATDEPTILQNSF